MQRISLSVIPIFILAFIVVSCAAPDTQSPELSPSAILKEERIQKELVIKTYETEELNILKIAYPLLKENADICPKVAHFSGISFWSVHHFNKEDRPFAAHALPIDEYVRVHHVFEGSFADQAGVKSGDILLMLNEKKIPKGRKGFETVRNFFKNNKKERFKAVFQRRTLSYEVDIKFEEICHYPIRYQSQNMEVNAFANGKTIFVTRGMQRFAQKEEEMAIIIAHELAHNTMLHMKKVRHNMAMGAVVGGMIDLSATLYGDIETRERFMKIGAFEGGFHNRVAFEIEADYVGLYMMERAGYDTQPAPNFWRRMAAENNASALKEKIGYATHPTSVKRFLALEKTRAEIEKKKKRGLPLLPNKKDRPYRIFKKTGLD